MNGDKVPFFASTNSRTFISLGLLGTLIEILTKMKIEWGTPKEKEKKISRRKDLVGMKCDKMKIKVVIGRHAYRLTEVISLDTFSILFSIQILITVYQRSKKVKKREKFMYKPLQLESTDVFM